MKRQNKKKVKACKVLQEFLIIVECPNTGTNQGKPNEAMLTAFQR